MFSSRLFSDLKSSLSIFHFELLLRVLIQIVTMQTVLDRIIYDMWPGRIWFVAKKKRERNLYEINFVRETNFLGQLLILWSRSVAFVVVVAVGFARNRPKTRRVSTVWKGISRFMTTSTMPAEWRRRRRRRRCILSSRNASRLCSHLPPARLPALFSVVRRFGAHTQRAYKCECVCACVCICDGAWSAFPSLFLKCDTTTTHAPNSVSSPRFARGKGNSCMFFRFSTRCRGPKTNLMASPRQRNKFYWMSNALCPESLVLFYPLAHWTHRGEYDVLHS